MKVQCNIRGLTREESEWGLGTENFGQFMIFELPICDTLYLLNLNRVAHKGQQHP